MSGSKDYALVFRVMRLARPSLAEDKCLRINLIEDMGPDRFVHPSVHSSVLPASLMGADAARVQLPSAVDAMNITGLLQLPDSFGRIYLGEVRHVFCYLNRVSVPPICYILDDVHLLNAEFLELHNFEQSIGPSSEQHPSEGTGLLSPLPL